jgi:hypothetical protein
MGETVERHFKTAYGTDTIQYNSRKYVLPVGQDVFLPFEAAMLWFGDPRANEGAQSLRLDSGVVTWLADRPTEVRRLHHLYDGQFSDESQIANYPIVQVWTLQNERIPTVLDDPSGENIIPAKISQSENEMLRLQMAKMQQQMEALTQRLGIESASTPTLVEPTIPADDAPSIVSQEPTTPTSENELVPLDELPEDNGIQE